MRLSTKARYGLRLMLNLASRYGDGPVLLREIAEREQISEKYLSLIIIPLRVDGLVQSARGAYGGYSLARAPEEITVKHIIHALEGETALVNCVKNPAACLRVQTCPTREVWNILGEKIGETLDGMTLASLVKKSRDKEENTLMNSI